MQNLGLHTKRQEEPGETIEETSGCVRLERVAQLLVGQMMMMTMMIWVYLNKNNLLHNGYRVFPVVKWPGPGVERPPLSSAKVKERVELFLYSTSGPSGLL